MAATSRRVGTWTMHPSLGRRRGAPPQQHGQRSREPGIRRIMRSRIYIKGAGTVLLEKSPRARHVSITVRPFRGVRVAVPLNVSFVAAEGIARSRAEWIKKHRSGMKRLEERYRSAGKSPVIPDPEKAAVMLRERLARLAEQYGYRYGRVTIRNQKTRWGSCSGQNNISLNIRIALLPDELRDYILLHELVHTKVKNHGQDFWTELLRVEPRARELAGRLRRLYIELV